jgi:hypothetical protein
VWNNPKTNLNGTVLRKCDTSTIIVDIEIKLLKLQGPCEGTHENLISCVGNVGLDFWLLTPSHGLGFFKVP